MDRRGKGPPGSKKHHLSKKQRQRGNFTSTVPRRCTSGALCEDFGQSVYSSTLDPSKISSMPIVLRQKQKTANCLGCIVEMPLSRETPNSSGSGDAMIKP